MRRFSYFSTKQKVLLISGAVLLIVLLSLGIYYFSIKDTKPSHQPSELADTETIDPDKPYQTSQGNLRGEEDTEEPVDVHPDVIIPYNIPLTRYGGTIEEYRDYSTFGEIDIAIAGDKDRKKTFEVVVGTIIFDTDHMKVLRPSELIKGSEARLIVQGIESLGQEIAQAILVGGNLEVTYTQVTDFYEIEDYLVLANKVHGVVHLLPYEGVFKDALTGKPFNLELLTIDSRAFVVEKSIYDGELPESIIKHYSPSHYRFVVVSEVYVYPTAN